MNENNEGQQSHTRYYIAQNPSRIHEMRAKTWKTVWGFFFQLFLGYKQKMTQFWSQPKQSYMPHGLVMQAYRSPLFMTWVCMKFTTSQKGPSFVADCCNLHPKKILHETKLIHLIINGSASKKYYQAAVTVESTTLFMPG